MLSDSMMHVLHMAANGTAFEPRHNRTIRALVDRGLVVGGPSTGWSAPPMAHLTREGRDVLDAKMAREMTREERSAIDRGCEG